VCHPNDHPRDSDLLDVNDGGRVRRVLPRKTRAPGDYRNVVPAAIYAASPQLFNFVEPNVPQDFVQDVFPRLARAGDLFAYQTPEYMRDMGTEARFAMAERDLASGRVEALRFDRPRPAVFFDRDGTLNEEVGGNGLTRAEELKLISGAAEAVRRVNDAGWLAVAVTNQPQLAKGFVTRRGLDEIHGRLDSLLGDAGAWLDRLYFCPHHPERGFEGEIADLKIECDCRKPKPGMILRAAEDLPVDLSASCVIGDTWRDIAAAHAVGIPGYGVQTGCRWTPDQQPDRMFESVLEAVVFGLKDCARIQIPE
jgi:histidinol-phosphate phosphatase family protein